MITQPTATNAGTSPSLPRHLPSLRAPLTMMLISFAALVALAIIHAIFVLPRIAEIMHVLVSRGPSDPTAFGAAIGHAFPPSLLLFSAAVALVGLAFFAASVWLLVVVITRLQR